MILKLQNMPSIRIQDKKQRNSGRFLSFDLKDILAVIGEPTLKSKWRCTKVWCIRVIDGEPMSFRDKRFKLSGEELTDFASKAAQVIDGRFEAKSEGATKHPWLIIVAFDSTFYEVWSSKSWVIEKLKDHFDDVTDISGELTEPVG